MSKHKATEEAEQFCPCTVIPIRHLASWHDNIPVQAAS